MIGFVIGLDACLGIGKIHFVAVDLRAIGDHPGNGTKAGTHPVGAGLHMCRQGIVKHLRIEFIGLTVGVDIGARKERMEERRTVIRRELKQLVHIAVLGAAQIKCIEARGIDKFLLIVAAAMG